MALSKLTKLDQGQDYLKQKNRKRAEVAVEGPSPGAVWGGNRRALAGSKGPYLMGRMNLKAGLSRPVESRAVGSVGRCPPGGARRGAARARPCGGLPGLARGPLHWILRWHATWYAVAAT